MNTADHPLLILAHGSRLRPRRQQALSKAAASFVQGGSKLCPRQQQALSKAAASFSKAAASFVQGGSKLCPRRQQARQTQASLPKAPMSWPQAASYQQQSPGHSMPTHVKGELWAACAVGPPVQQGRVCGRVACAAGPCVEHGCPCFRAAYAAGPTLLQGHPAAFGPFLVDPPVCVHKHVVRTRPLCQPRCT